MTTENSALGQLFIVPTPIGNLQDMSPRAISVLNSVQAIACEDTRHSRPLLQHFAINTPCFSYHEFNEADRSAQMLLRLQQGENIALISDAGTPLICDPGYRIVQGCRQAGIEVVTIPGPCALTTALSGAGLPTDRFVFEGFFPVKQQAKIKQIEQLNQQTLTSIFYEAPRRIVDTLAIAEQYLDRSIQVVLAKEISKTFERFICGTASDLLAWLQAKPEHQKGEFVLLFGPAQRKDGDLDPQALRLLTSLLSEVAPKKACALVAEHYGLKKNELYQWTLAQSRN